MPDQEETVRRTVDTVGNIADKAARFSGKVLLGATIVCVGSFVLGIQALSGGIETVWIVLSIVFGAIAIGGAAVALWRAFTVKRHLPEITDEVRSMVNNGDAGTRTVIETFEVPDDRGGSSAIVMSRQMGGFRGSMGTGLANYQRLSAATSALAAFPFQMLFTILISMVFGFLGFIFLIALAL